MKISAGEYIPMLLSTSIGIDSRLNAWQIKPYLAVGKKVILLALCVNMRLFMG